MQLAAGPASQESLAAADLLLAETRKRSAGSAYDFFGNFFLAHGMARLGGVPAAETQRFQADLFTRWQLADGSWAGTGAEQAPGRVYATSMAVLSLAAREQRLPLARR